MPGFAKAKSFYEKEFPPNSKKHWPYDEPTEERAYKEWLKIVVDPSTEEFYKGPNGEEPKHTVTQIVRLRTSEGAEKLYSIGSVRGYNMYHDPVIADLNNPESYWLATFNHQTMQDERDGHAKRFTTGIEETTKQYILDFSPDNVEMLLAKKNPKGCMLTVKDESSSRVKECRDLEMFKSKSIQYILNDEWQTPEQRQAVIKEKEYSEGRTKR
jgi:hypothetical protein